MRDAEVAIVLVNFFLEQRDAVLGAFQALGCAHDADEEVVIAHNWDELRRFMWNYVGIVRTTKRLERAQHRIALLKEEIDEYYRNFRITHDLLELRNLVDVASMIVNSALSRRESRGLHFSRDYPETLPKAIASVLTPPHR